MKKLEMEEEGFIPIGLEGAFENAYDEDEKDSKFSFPFRQTINYSRVQHRLGLAF